MFGEYVRLRERARGVGDPEDVIPGLRELRASSRIAQDNFRAAQGEPRPVDERWADWELVGWMPEQPDIPTAVRTRWEAEHGHTED